MKRPGDDEAVALLRRTADAIEKEELSVLKLYFEDDDRWVLKVTCGAGDRAVSEAKAQAREQELADAGHRSPAAPSRARPPVSTDACPKCGVVGKLRDAGGLDWMCIGCQHEFTPGVGRKE